MRPPIRLLSLAVALAAAPPVASVAATNVAVSKATVSVPAPFILMTSDPESLLLGIDVGATLSRSEPGGVTETIRVRYAVSFVPPLGGDPVGGGTHIVEYPGITRSFTGPITASLDVFPAAMLSDAFEYDVTVAISHEEDSGWVDDGPAVVATRIGHFESGLVAGDAFVRVGGFSAPPVFLGNPGRWRIAISGGTLPNDVPVLPDPASPTLLVRRDPAFGRMTLLDGSLLVDAPAPAGVPVQGFDADLGPLTLDESGLAADGICLDLPAGIGWRGGPLGLLQQELCASGQILIDDETYEPLGAVSGALPAGSEIVADVLPLGFSAASWTLGRSGLVVPAPGVRFLRSANYQTWEVLHGGDRPDSNAGLWADVAPAADSPLTITPGPAGGLSVDLSIGVGGFFSHFPAGFVAHKGGDVRIVNSRIEPARSSLEAGVASVLYSRDCPPCPGEDGAPVAGLGFISVGPTTLTLTPSGGLHGTGTPTNASLLIGTTPSGDAVHETDAFAAANFLMPGAMVPPEDGFDDPIAPDGGVDEPGERPAAFNPARHLLTAVDPATLAPEHPGTAAFAAGLGDRAGANFRRFDGMKATSRIGDGPAVEYAVADWWRGYARQSGFTGVHQSAPDDVPPAISSWGYTIDLDNLGWSYLSNLAVESITAGDLEIPYPADFTVELERLFIDCCGQPSRFDLVAGSEDRLLAYWDDAEIRLRSGRFSVVGGGATCCGGDGLLELGVDAPVGGVPELQAGLLYPLPDGHLTDGTEPHARVSRLLLGPTTVRQYGILPVTDVTFNDPDDHPSGPGWQNVAGLVDVSFFEDVRAHVQTTGHEEPLVADVHILGGWTDDAGETHFTSPDFDAGHRGFAPSAALLAEYRTEPQFFPVVEKDTFIGRFEYPVEWHELGDDGFFQSEDAVPAPLVVDDLPGEVRFLDREHADIQFGEQFALIPKLTLSNLAGLGIDAGTEAIADAVLPWIDNLQTLIDTTTAIRSTNLQARFAANLGPALDFAVVDPLVDNVLASDCQPATVDALVQIHIDPFTAVSTALQVMSGAIAAPNVTALPATWQAQLQSIRDDLVEFRAEWLTEDSMRDLLEIVVGAVPNENIDPDLLEEVWVELLGTGPLENAFERAREFTDELIVLLDEVIEGLEEAGEALGVLQDTLAAQPAELADAIGDLNSGAMEAIRNHLLLTLCANPGAYTDDEIRDWIRTRLVDAILGLDMIAAVETGFRNFVYHFFESVEEVVGTLLDFVNVAARTVASTILFLPDAPLRAVQGFGTHFLTGGLRGQALAEGDDLRQFRLDGRFGLHLRRQIEFDGYLIYNHLTSEGPEFCNDPDAVRAHELVLGASGTYSKFLGSTRKLAVEAKFGFADHPAGDGAIPLGFAGTLEMIQGDFNWTSLNASGLSAHVAVGREGSDFYLASGISAEMPGLGQGFALTGGFFLGRTCHDDPLSWLPGEPADGFDGFLPFPVPFSGGIAYAEGAANLIGRSCLARLRVGAGIGGYLLAGDDPGEGAWGGRVKGSASGELLCIMSGKGEITLDGRLIGNDFEYQGKASISRRTIWGGTKTRSLETRYRTGEGWSFKR